MGRKLGARWKGLGLNSRNTRKLPEDLSRGDMTRSFLYPCEDG